MVSAPAGFERDAGGGGTVVQRCHCPARASHGADYDFRGRDPLEVRTGSGASDCFSDRGGGTTAGGGTATKWAQGAAAATATAGVALKTQNIFYPAGTWAAVDRILRVLFRSTVLLRGGVDGALL